jgi:hypothetical protein
MHDHHRGLARDLQLRRRSRSASVRVYPARLEEAVCEAEVRCEEFPDVASCMQSIGPLMGQVVASVNAGRVHYDASAARLCLDATASRRRNTTDLFAPSQGSCRDTFKGTLPGSAGCLSPAECLSGICLPTSCSSNACCAGVCAADPATAVRVAVGGDCSGENVLCVDGAYCDGRPPICMATSPLGQPCDPAAVASGLCLGLGQCAASSSALGGTCTLPAAEGQPCDARIGCNASTDHCDSVSGTCVHRAMVGKPCDSSVWGTCVGFARCDSSTQTCVALARAGEPCDDGQGTACLGMLVCRGGACVLPDPPPVCQ